MSRAFSAVFWPVSSQDHGHGEVLFWHYVTGFTTVARQGSTQPATAAPREKGALSALKRAGLIPPICETAR